MPGATQSTHPLGAERSRRTCRVWARAFALVCYRIRLSNSIVVTIPVHVIGLRELCVGRPADERRIDRIFLPSRARSFVSHSQTTDTRQPIFFSSFAFILSRSTFSRNFFCQKLILLFGVYANLQPRWRCHKQPCTKLRRRRRRSTMSGFPGSFRG